MSRRELLSFRQEIRLRNQLLDMLADWTSDSVGNKTEPGDEEKLSRDLDLSCLKVEDERWGDPTTMFNLGMFI